MTTVGSVDRALTLIQLVLDVGSVTVTEAATTLGVNASTAHRLLATIAQREFLVRGSDRRYRPGTALGLHDVRTSRTACLRPYLEQLHARVGETVHLTMLGGTQVYHLDGIEGEHRGMPVGLRVGTTLPAHHTAAGKVLLAQLPVEEVNLRYGVASRSPRGRHLLVDLVSLRAELAEIRVNRVGWNFEQHESGVTGIAIAVTDRTGAHSALSIAVPATRIRTETARHWASELERIADDIADEDPTSGP